METKISTNNIKAFFFDNDSTVFNHSGKGEEILQSTYEGLRKLREKGYKVCMITSRSYEEMYNMPKDFMELFDDVCLLSGAYIVSSDGSLDIKTIDHDSTVKIINKLDKLDITYRYATNKGNGYISKHDESKEAIFKRLYDMIPEIKKYDNEEVSHFVVYTSDEIASSIFNEIKNIEYSHVGVCAEFSPKNIDKGLTLVRMCKKYGISPDESCAFGDSGNDISMFNKAGLSVCLGNGQDALKEIADYVTDNIWEDGLYNGLKHFGFID